MEGKGVSYNFLDLLSDYKNNIDEILDEIRKSNVFKNYSEEEYPYFRNKNERVIYLGINYNNMKKMLNLDKIKNFDAIQNWCSGSELEMENYDDYVVDYLFRVTEFLDDDNLMLLKKILISLGVGEFVVDNMMKKYASVTKFFSQNNLEEINDLFFDKIDEVVYFKLKEVICGKLNELPFSIKYGTLDIEKLIRFIKRNGIYSTTFDRLVIDISNNIPDFDLVDAIKNLSFTAKDLANLNHEMRKKLSEVLANIEGEASENLVLNKKSEIVKKVNEYLSDIGFDSETKTLKHGDNFYIVEKILFPENLDSLKKINFNDINIDLIVRKPNKETLEVTLPLEDLREYIF